jgi:peroxiredoxin 2/4
LKRTIIALQTADKGNLVTPANWNPGDDLMIRALTPSEEKSLDKSDSSLYQYSWFMTFKRVEFSK